MCEPCSAGSFCPGGVAAASSCPSNTTSLSSAVSVTDCLCLAGFAGIDGVHFDPLCSTLHQLHFEFNFFMITFEPGRE